MKYKHLLDEKKGRKNDISKFMIKSYHCHPSINLTFCKMNHIYNNFTEKGEKMAIQKIGILLPKLFWPTVRKNCSSDRENFLKFEAEGR